jgi:hypothetical protein
LVRSRRRQAVPRPGTGFWRNGDGLNIALDAQRGFWFDFRDNTGGDIVSLVETAKQCTFPEAARWLADHVGMSLSPATGHPERTDTDWPADLRRATWWRIAAVALLDRALETLPDTHPERQGLTSLVSALSLGPATLVDEYREWCRRAPAITYAMVRAGRRADARGQKRLALWLMRRCADDPQATGNAHH